MCSGQYTAPGSQSLPVRGAWIEMQMMTDTCWMDASLPVRGAWIEIRSQHGLLGQYRRSPCGERGLKFLWGNSYTQVIRSLPVRGAWIEIE